MLVRKSVTILFTDVVTSTELGGRLDPESLRRVMNRWFEEMRGVVERHGGTVEKFIGDEVMAVFGVPAVHEDDALRAVRAAAEMRERLEDLNTELEAGWGVRLQARTGVNTGEVVAGDPSTGQTFVTGEPVVLAKRLEQAAKPGEILLGKATYPLVRDAISAGPLQSFPAKGVAHPVAPWRLDEVEAGAPGLARRLEAPLVGRQAELAALHATFEEVARGRTCHLVTVFGPAGIGKSRLAAELVTSLGDEAEVVTGRCLPYGEGITFWPLVQIVREVGGEPGLAAALEGVEDASLIAERVRSAIGASPASTGSEETFWAVRRFLEALARERPLVVVLEDIHWAEPTFLDLVEYLAGWSRGASILLLCLARRELLDRQPAWTSPRPNVSTLVLEPLSETDAAALLDELREEEALSDRAIDQIADAAEGNPLFLEQLVAMAIEEGGGADAELRVPPSIQAVLAERLDRLSTGERAVIERAAVIGKDFLRSAVLDLCAPDLQPLVGRHLMELVRKELIRPDVSASARDDGFRFRHVLIRDAAYDGMPKEIRAELHEHFAVWMEANVGGTEVDEIVGYHFERAFRYRAELGRLDESTGRLALAAGERLALAGRRAFARGDVPAAVNLLGRAVSLLASAESADPRLLLDLGAALREHGEAERAEGALAEAEALVMAVEDECLGLRVLIERTFLRMYLDPTVEAREILDVAERATPVFEAEGDALGLLRAWNLVAEAHWMRCRGAPMEEVLERALGYAQRAGDRREVASILGAMARVALMGPRPVEEGIARCLEIRERALDEPTVLPVTDLMLAVLEAMSGRPSEAREYYRRSGDALEELGLKRQLASLRMYAGAAELIAGDPAAAERELRPGYDALERMGERGYLSTLAGYLAQAVYAQGRLDEAERLTGVADEAASEDDLVSQVMWRGTRAKVLARRGASEPAERLVREAIALSRETDFLNMHADALLDLAEVLLVLERPEEAVEPAEEAVSLYETKGNVVSAERAAGLLRELQAAPSA